MEISTPQITVHLFAEFSTRASARKKGNILQTQKFPKEGKFMSNLYNSCSSTLVKFMMDPNHDPSIFKEMQQKISNRQVNNDWQKNDKANSLLAAKAMEKSAEKVLRPYFLYHAKKLMLKAVNVISIRGINIKLNPSVLLYDKAGEKVIGALKFIFSKTSPISPMDGQIMTGLIKQRLEKQLKVKLDNNNIGVVDVFAQKVITAPDSFSYHKRVINKSCDEINGLWAKVKKKV